MEYNREGTRDLLWIKSDNTEVDPDPKTGNVALGVGTYFAPLGDESAPAPAQTSLDSVHIKWDAAFVGVFTIETSNFPRRKGGQWVGSDDVTNHDTTRGNWIRESPPTGYISTTSTDGTTGGATPSAASVSVAGGTAGGCMIHIGNLGSRRTRIRADVTTPGAVRTSHTGKNAA